MSGIAGRTLSRCRAEWVAMVVALAAQAYLLLGPSGAAEAPA